MSREKQQGVAIIPTTENRPSGYTCFVPVPWQGEMRDGRVFEPGDEADSLYADGYAELRREALKARRRSESAVEQR